MIAEGWSERESLQESLPALERRVRLTEQRLVDIRHQFQIVGSIVLLIGLGCLLWWLFRGVTERLAATWSWGSDPDLLSRW